MKRIETDGSYWFFDEDAKTYLRFPKEEKPREDPSWAAPQTILADAVPHPYESYYCGPRCLVIVADTTGLLPHWIYAPVGGGTSSYEVNLIAAALIEKGQYP